MASWQDPIIQFKEYKPENPSEAMLTVGLTRQQQYQEGLQKIQTFQAGLSELESPKKEINDYLNSRISELYSNINDLSGDFSNQRLVNQIGGAAMKIANDPIIKNGISAKNTISRIETEKQLAKKEGKSAIQNEYDADSRILEWLNDGSESSTLNVSFSQYFDIEKKVRDIVKEMGESQDLPDGAVRYNSEGNLEVNSTLMKGKSYERVQAAINQVMSTPEAQNQLRIDGKYKYRGIDKKEMYNLLKQSTQTNIENLNDKIKEAQVQLATIITESDKKRDLAQQILNWKKQADALSTNFPKYTEKIETDLEGLKTSLVEQDLATQLATIHPYMNLVENPEWNQRFKERELEQRAELEKIKQAREDAKEREKELKESAKNTPGFSVGTVLTSDEEGNQNEASFIEEKQRVAELVDHQQKQLIYSAYQGGTLPPPYIPDPQNPDSFIPNIQGYKEYYKTSDLNKIKDDIKWDGVNTLATLKQRQQSGKNENDNLFNQIEALQENEDNLKLLISSEKEINKKIAPKLEDLKKGLTEKEYFGLLIKNKLPGWQSALKSLTSDLKKEFAGQSVEILGKKISTDLISEKDLEKILTNPIAINQLNNQAAKKIGFDISKISNPIDLSTKAALSERNDLFKSIQRVYEKKAAFLNFGKPEDKDNIRRNFAATLKEITDIKGKQDAEEILEVLNDEKSEGVRPYVYITYENGIKKGVVGVEGMKGSKKQSIEQVVNFEDFATNFKDFIPSTQANDRYQYRFNQTQGYSTGKKNSNGTIDVSRETAINKKVFSGQDKYQIQYHLISADRQNYQIKVWINKNGTDLINGSLILDGQAMPLSSAYSTVEGSLLNPANIEALIYQMNGK